MRQPALTTTAAYQALAAHHIDIQDKTLRQLFAAAPKRFEAMSLDAAGLYLDYSKNRLTADTIALLANLARTRGVEQRRDAMFTGEKINTTEGRAVLHTALRMPRGKALNVAGQDVAADVHAVLDLSLIHI